MVLHYYLPTGLIMVLITYPAGGRVMNLELKVRPSTTRRPAFGDVLPPAASASLVGSYTVTTVNDPIDWRVSSISREDGVADAHLWVTNLEWGSHPVRLITTCVMSEGQDMHAPTGRDRAGSASYIIYIYTYRLSHHGRHRPHAQHG